MSDFYGALLSASFKVKNTTKFWADPKVRNMKKWIDNAQGFFEADKKTHLIAFGFDGQYPSSIVTEFSDTGSDIEWDMAEVIRPHLRPRETVVIGVSGQEKLRCIGGILIVVTGKGVAHSDLPVVDWTDRCTGKTVTQKVTAFLKRLKKIGA